MFTYVIFNVITFMMCALLRKVPIDLGFALGLFAVFGILRYRTEEIRLRDLNYQFVVIGVAILNAVTNKKVSFAEVLAVNVVVAATVIALELAPALRRHCALPVTYDNLALLHDDQRPALLADLSARLGVAAHRVQVHRIDTLRDAAEITVFYQLPRATAARLPAPPHGASTPLISRPS